MLGGLGGTTSRYGFHSHNRGRIIERNVGTAEIEVKGQSTYSIVVFGVTTLKKLGLQADPVTRELKPLELLLLKLLIKS